MDQIIFLFGPSILSRIHMCLGLILKLLLLAQGWLWMGWPSKIYILWLLTSSVYGTHFAWKWPHWGSCVCLWSWWATSWDLAGGSLSMDAFGWGAWKHREYEEIMWIDLICCSQITVQIAQGIPGFRHIKQSLGLWLYEGNQLFLLFQYSSLVKELFGNAKAWGLCFSLQGGLFRASWF